MKRNVSLLAILLLACLVTPTFAFNYKFWEYIFPPKKEVLSPLQQIRKLDRVGLQADIKATDQYMANMADRMDQVNQDVRMLNLEGAEILNTIKDIIDSSTDDRTTPLHSKTNKVDSTAAKQGTPSKPSRLLQTGQVEAENRAEDQSNHEEMALHLLKALMSSRATKSANRASGPETVQSTKATTSRVLEQIDELASLFGVDSSTAHSTISSESPHPQHLKRSEFDQETLDNWSAYFGDSKEVEKLIDVLLRKSESVRKSGENILATLRKIPPKWD